MNVIQLKHTKSGPTTFNWKSFLKSLFSSCLFSDLLVLCSIGRLCCAILYHHFLLHSDLFEDIPEGKWRQEPGWFPYSCQSMKGFHSLRSLFLTLPTTNIKSYLLLSAADNQTGKSSSAEHTLKLSTKSQDKNLEDDLRHCVCFPHLRIAIFYPGNDLQLWPSHNGKWIVNSTTTCINPAAIIGFYRSYGPSLWTEEHREEVKHPQIVRSRQSSGFCLSWRKRNLKIPLHARLLWILCLCRAIKGANHRNLAPDSSSAKQKTCMDCCPFCAWVHFLEVELAGPYLLPVWWTEK